MRELKSSRHILVAGLAPFNEGDVFSKWPKHITILPWFSVGRQKRLHNVLEKLSINQHPLVATVGRYAMFGNGKVPVHLVEPADELKSFHTVIMTATHNIGAEFEDLQYMGYNYRPHITNLNHETLQNSYDLGSMALISQTPARYKQVDKVFEFRG